MDLTFPGTEGKNMSHGFPLIQQVRAYWEGLRDGSALPARTAIDPRGLSGALEHVFLVERVAPGIARLRLAGMHLAELMGMEVPGMPLSAMFDPPARLRLAEAIETCFAGSAALDMWLEAGRGIGRPALSGRMTLLPVISSRGRPDLALGCLETRGAIGRPPRRLAIAALVQEPLTAQAAPAPRPAPQAAPRPASGLSEAAAPYLPPPVPGRPHLRLVHSRD